MNFVATAGENVFQMYGVFAGYLATFLYTCVGW